VALVANRADPTIGRLRARVDTQGVPARHPGYLALMGGRGRPMTMVKTPIEIDHEALDEDEDEDES
jgi:hypothetical protein